jgi:hypothetical protein
MGCVVLQITTPMLAVSEGITVTYYRKCWARLQQMLTEAIDLDDAPLPTALSVSGKHKQPACLLLTGLKRSVHLMPIKYCCEL